MKLRSPPLPEDLQATWPFFIEHIPDWLFIKHTRISTGGDVLNNWIGEQLVQTFANIQEALGEHFLPNPLKPPPKHIKLGGNPAAFHAWVRDMLTKNRGKIRQ